MKKKIIILCLKLTEFKSKIIELEKLKEVYDIEIHECIDFLLPKSKINFGKKKKFKNLITFKNFTSWKHYLLKLNTNSLKNKKRIIVLDTISDFDHFGNNFYWFLIYYNLKKLNIFFIKLHFPGLPMYNEKKKLSFFYVNKIFANIKTLLIRPLYSIGRIKEIFFLLLGKLLKLYPNLIFVAGKQDIVRLKSQRIKSMKIVPFLTNDYSQHLIEGKKKNFLNLKGKYAVFLSDRDYNLVPEDALYQTNYKPTLTYENWHKPLTNFFNFLENNLGIKIIIAAHPKSFKINTKKIYHPRKVYFNKTNQLLKNSKFAITQRSTALNFAVIHSKPIMFISSTTLTKTVNRHIEFIANKFHQSPIDINKKIEEKKIKEFLNFKMKKLKEYKVNYISTVKSKKPNFKIIIENINAL